VTSIEGAEIVHRKAGATDLAGLLIPNIWPGEQAARAYRLRRDKPDYEQQHDGTVKERGKYLNVQEDLNRLYFPPCSPQKFGLALSGILFQAVFVVQTTENWHRCDAVTGGQRVPIDSSRNSVIEWFRDSGS
jgi:hypothetical protein